MLCKRNTYLKLCIYILKRFKHDDHLTSYPVSVITMLLNIAYYKTIHISKINILSILFSKVRSTQHCYTCIYKKIWENTRCSVGMIDGDVAGKGMKTR